MTFVGLIVRNWATRRLRLAFVALAIGVGVMTVVTFNVVNHSLHTSAIALLQTGRADFTIAQKGVSDIVNSNIDEADIDRLGSYPGVAGVTGVLIGATHLNSANPQFLLIGIRPDHSIDARGQASDDIPQSLLRQVTNHVPRGLDVPGPHAA